MAGRLTDLTIGQKRAIWAWGFLALPIAFYVAIRFYPTVEAFRASFTNWNIVGRMEYVGVANYARLVQDPAFWKVIGNTFAYLGLGVPISMSPGSFPCRIACTNLTAWRTEAGPSAPNDINPPISANERDVEAAGIWCLMARSTTGCIDRLPCTTSACAPPFAKVPNALSRSSGPRTMGMRDELKISHTFRRLTALAQQFGDTDHHLARLAALEF